MDRTEPAGQATVQRQCIGEARRGKHCANEISADKYWDGTDQEYIDTLNVAYDAIKSQDPGMTVVPAGFASGVIGAAASGIGQYAEKINLVLEQGKYDALDLHLYHEIAQELAPMTLATAAEGAPIRLALSTSFAFGGNNAALLFAHPDFAGSSRRPAAGCPAAA